MADHDALTALHTALIDSRNGYDEALKDANDAAVKPILQKVRDLHDQAHSDVHAMLTAVGETPDEEGSLMTTVHETVISVRSAVGALGKGSLSSFASGEENNLKKYDEAIAAGSAHADTLGRHRAALVGAVEAMKRQAE